jgi:hypothetical protein
MVKHGLAQKGDFWRQVLVRSYSTARRLEFDRLFCLDMVDFLEAWESKSLDSITNMSSYNLSKLPQESFSISKKMLSKHVPSSMLVVKVKVKCGYSTLEKQATNFKSGCRTGRMSYRRPSNPVPQHR